MSDDFFAQWPTPIDTFEIGGFDILGLPEVQCLSGMVAMKHFEVAKHFTPSEIIEYCTRGDSFFSSITVPSDSYLLIADMKNDKIIEAVKELKEIIVKEFSEDIKKLSGNVVQYVETPVCLIDRMPGNTAISFTVFTNRILGASDETA